MKIENMTINGVTIGAINIMGGAGTVSTDLGDEGIKNLESVLKGALAGKTAECLSLGKQEGLVLGKEEGLVLGKEEAPGLSLGTPMPKGDDAAPGDDELHRRLAQQVARQRLPGLPVPAQDQDFSHRMNSPMQLMGVFLNQFF